MQPTIENTIPKTLSLKETATLLVKHFGYHEGLYDIAFAVQVAVGQVGPAPETQFPGAAFGISGIELAKVQQAGPNTVDAAEVNPSTRPARPAPAKKARRAKAA
jgi:hypothetical protein